MKTLILSTALLTSFALNAQEWHPTTWPSLKVYDSGHLEHIALPLGGIGTGTVSLGGRGELKDWEIMNIPAKGYSTVTKGNNAPFFSIFVQPQNGKSQTSLLAGPLYDHEYLHAEGRPVNHHGFPRFSNAEFRSTYPFGEVCLSDEELPVKVEVKGFNPLIPGNSDASGLPVAVLSYAVTNVGNESLDVAVCGSLRNFIGKDGHEFRTDWKGDNIPIGARSNKNEYRENSLLKGVYFYSEKVDSLHPAWGTMALTTTSKEGVSYRLASKKDSWNNAILNFWDEFSDDGILKDHWPMTEDDPMASLAVKKRIAPNETKYFTFYLTWNFPNRKAWSASVVGNYYSRKYADAWDSACKIVPEIPELESQTLQFVNAILRSSYPDVVKEAALFNLATLRSQTVFRLPDGHLMGWEGIMDRFGSCMGSCTHVWNYEMATHFLFGDLARSMRDVEFNYATKENGLMNFRAALPLLRAAEGNNAAADGQMGCILKFYLDWQLSGDSSFLAKNWEQVKKVLSYAWIDHGWDGNCDGVMEGSQHNTMDVNYFGPNPQMGFWYLGALRAAESMAVAMKDRPFAKKCRLLFKKGSQWMDENLFNGEYYEHKITDPTSFDFLAVDDPNTKIPEFQLGRGCLVDQLVGQYMAHLCGLGYLALPAHIRTTLGSIMKYNYVSDFSRHFNNMRSYVMGKEAGLLMASWPKGRLEVPFPYFAEVMTGFEYCAAVGMLYEGMTDDAIKCIQAIRDRHNGSKRNPFSEPECGHHYARSMASWSSIIALGDFHYSGVNQEMHVTDKPGTYFWSNGASWGNFVVKDNQLTIDVIYGQLKLKRVQIGEQKLKKCNVNLRAGESTTL